MNDMTSPIAWALADDATAKAPGGVAIPFNWPSPPYASYPSSIVDDQPPPCEVEGTNRKVMSGRLLAIDPVQRIAQLLIPPSRNAISLRFSQFRRLTLTAPVAPLAAGSALSTLSTLAPILSVDGIEELGLLDAQTAVEVRLRLVGDADEGSARTVGHVEHESGVFLFPPLDAEGRVLRVFVPRSSISSIEFGPRPGDLVVDEHSSRPGQLQALVEQRLREQKVGDAMAAQRCVNAEQLVMALQHQASMPAVRVGEALVALGYIVPSQLDEALERQKDDKSVPLGELLVRLGHVTRANLRTALARKMGYPVVDVAAFPIDRDLLGRFAQSAAERLRALPIVRLGARVIVAMDDPSRGDALVEAEFLLQSKALPVLAQTDDFSQAIAHVYQGVSEPAAAGGAAQGEAPGADLLLAQLEEQSGERGDSRDETPIEQSDNSLVRLINAMIVEAHAKGVSDIHVECPAGREKVRIRFRRDGSLKPYMELPPAYRSALLARIKIMCDLDISERRRPQDGKINFDRFVPGMQLELRVATIPTSNGNEDAVLRLLASAKPIPLDKLNLSPRNFATLIEAIQRPYGMVLCVGPTGSGKTTTLHSALSRINTPERKIWTAEDPVEITQAGLRQVQVNPKIEWTFAKALRAFLRADPDVVMVGEIRDTETARIAVEASLTGHLVMSTLHTNSAPETVTRLLDMGLDPFNFADSLLAVLAQRLLKRLCPKCVQAKPATAEQIDEWLADHLHSYGAAERQPAADGVIAEWKQRFGRDGTLMHHHAPGCDHCDGSGFRGRVGIHELLTVDREIRHLIQTGARVEQLQQAAMATGMRTLRQDGIEKLLAGLTTIEEVRATSNA